MPYANFHINQGFSDIFLKAYAVGLSIVAPWLKSFKRTSWRTGFISRLNKRLYKIQLLSEGLKNVVKEFDAQRATEEYPFSKDLLSQYRAIYTLLEKNDFFNNPEMQDLSEKSLSNFYAIESYLRSLAFSGKSQTIDDSGLTAFASQVSLSSLQD